MPGSFALLRSSRSTRLLRPVLISIRLISETYSPTVMRVAGPAERGRRRCPGLKSAFSRGSVRILEPRHKKLPPKNRSGAVRLSLCGHPLVRGVEDYIRCSAGSPSKRQGEAAKGRLEEA